jgi:hypothetical protein
MSKMEMEWKIDLQGPPLDDHDNNKLPATEQAGWPSVAKK